MQAGEYSNGSREYPIIPVTHVELAYRGRVDLGEFAVPGGMKGKTTEEQWGVYDSEARALGDAIPGKLLQHTPSACPHSEGHSLLIPNHEAKLRYGVITQASRVPPEIREEMCQDSARLGQAHPECYKQYLYEHFGGFRSVSLSIYRQGLNLFDGPWHANLELLDTPPGELVSVDEINDPDVHDLLTKNEVGQRNGPRIIENLRAGGIGEELGLDYAHTKVYTSGAVHIPIPDVATLPEVLEKPEAPLFYPHARQVIWDAFEQEQPPIPKYLRCGAAGLIYRRDWQPPVWAILGSAVLGPAKSPSHNGELRHVGGTQEMGGTALLPGERWSKQQSDKYCQRGARRVQYLRELAQAQIEPALQSDLDAVYPPPQPLHLEAI